MIKSYTNIEQSKKLAEILPIESADMWWSRCTITDFSDGVLKVSYAVEPCNISQFRNTKEDIPCWSLAALLDVFENKGFFYKLYFDGVSNILEVVDIDNPNIHEMNYNDYLIDACYKLILKLHELKLL